MSKQGSTVDLYQSLIFNFGFNRWSYRWVIAQWIIREDGFRGQIDLFDTRFMGLCSEFQFQIWNLSPRKVIRILWNVRKLSLENDKTRGFRFRYENGSNNGWNFLFHYKFDWLSLFARLILIVFLSNTFY